MNYKRSTQKGRKRMWIWQLLIATLFIALFSMVGQRGFIQAQDSQPTPITLNSGECATDTISITLDESPIPKLDVLFLVDLSVSMEDVNKNIASNVEQIVGDIRQLVPNASFGLATFVDFPSAERTDGIYPWNYDLPLTEDMNALQEDLDRVSQTSFFSGEAGESYLYALRETTRSVTWREGSRRIVVLLGDAAPHQSIDKDVAEWLDEDNVIAQLITSDITVLSIYTQHYKEIPDHESYFNNEVKPFFEGVASETGGHDFPLDNVDQVPGAVQQVVSETVTNVQKLTLDPGFTGETKVEWSPQFYADVEAGKTYQFEVDTCVAPDIDGGSVSFQILGLADGAVVSRVQQNIQIPNPTATPTNTPTTTPTTTPLPTATPTPTPAGFIAWFPPGGDVPVPWWVYLIPILLLILLLLWWWKNRNKNAPRKIGPPPPRSASGKPPNSSKKRSEPSMRHGRGKRRRK